MRDFRPLKVPDGERAIASFDIVTWSSRGSVCSVHHGDVRAAGALLPEPRAVAGMGVRDFAEAGAGRWCRGQRLARAGRVLVRHRSMWDACAAITGNSLTVPFAEAGCGLYR